MNRDDIKALMTMAVLMIMSTAIVIRALMSSRFMGPKVLRCLNR